MKIVEGKHYRAKDIGKERIWQMGIPPHAYPTNQLVLVTRVASVGSWCVIDCPDGHSWKIKKEYLAPNCIWEVE